MTANNRPLNSDDATSNGKLDLYQHVTDTIVAALESGSHGKWVMPWHSTATPGQKGFAVMPENIDGRGNRAFYAIGADVIVMPTFGQFKTPEDYYSTRGHETVHWTGHETRCKREFGSRFETNAYAFEELVAELGAAFLCGHLNLTNEPRPDHAAYLASWLTVLKADKRAIFTAASAAQKAVDFIIAKSEGQPEPAANEAEFGK